MQPHESERRSLPGGVGQEQDRERTSFGEYQSIISKIERTIDRGIVRVLFTDVDATFVLGAGHRPEEIDQSHRDMRQLTAKLNKLGFIIIPVTGSHFDSGTNTTNSIRTRIEQGILPLVGEHHHDRDYTVDAYVSDGGAIAVARVEHDSAVIDSHYARRVSPTHLDYDHILTQALSLAETVNAQPFEAHDLQLIAQYDEHPVQSRMGLQPGTSGGYHRKANKVAFHFYAKTLEERDSIEVIFRKAMAPYGLQIVCCEEKDSNSAARRHVGLQPHLQDQSLPLKYCLDIVPFNKASAVSYFTEYISCVSTEVALTRGVSRPQLEVWACGDSGNDFPLMVVPVVSHVVVVGGASQELIRLAERLSNEGKQVFVEEQAGRLGPASIAAAIPD